MPDFKIIDISQKPEIVRETLNQFPRAGVGHLPEWGNIIKNAYGMDGRYLAAMDGSEVVGLLPLVFVRSRIFKNALVSMPYLNDGGILTKNQAVEQALWSESKVLMKKMDMAYVELRHGYEVNIDLIPRKDKISVVLDLTEGKEKVWLKKLHQNVRNKIRKSEKMGVEIKEGAEWLDAFYKMHLINMKELGSPAHSSSFFSEMIKSLKDRIRVYVALIGNNIIGGKIVCYFKDTVFFLWVSSPKEYHHYACVSLMNWRAIADAIDNGLKYCDFGRSTANSSHHEFKKKWGATNVQLFWHVYPETDVNLKSGSSYNKYVLFSQIWKHLPISILRLVGPKLRSGLPQ